MDLPTLLQFQAEIEHAGRVIDEFAKLLGDQDYGVQTARAAQQAALDECMKARRHPAKYTDASPILEELLRLISALDRAVIALGDDLADAL